jgi:hypothetical protein
MKEDKPPVTVDTDRLDQLRSQMVHTKIGELFNKHEITGKEALLVIGLTIVTVCKDWPAGQGIMVCLLESLVKSIKAGDPGNVDLGDLGTETQS